MEASVFGRSSKSIITCAEACLVQHLTEDLCWTSPLLEITAATRASFSLQVYTLSLNCILGTVQKRNAWVKTRRSVLFFQMAFQVIRFKVDNKTKKMRKASRSLLSSHPCERFISSSLQFSLASVAMQACAMEAEDVDRTGDFQIFVSILLCGRSHTLKFS